MTNKISSFPALNNPQPLHRHGGLLDVMSELQVSYIADDYTVQGTGNVRSLPTLHEGAAFLLKMKGTPTFVNSAKLICPGATDYAAQIGDLVVARSDGDGIWRLFVTPASGAYIADHAVSLTPTQRSQARLNISASSRNVELVSLTSLMALAFSMSTALFSGVSFADSFGVVTYVNTGGSTNLDSSSVGLLRPSSVLIPGATGTSFGGFTNGGGLAAAFDGTTSQTQATGALITTSNAGYGQWIGKDWGSGNTKIIGRLRIYGPSDANFLGAAGGTTAKLQGSSDNFASSIVDLTGGITLPTGNGQVVDVTTGIDVSTAYRYHRVAYNGNGTNSVGVAEQQFYSFDAANNMVAKSASLPVGAVPTSVVVAMRMAYYGTVLPGTDYNVAVSRDGGTTFSSNATLTDMGTDPTGPAHVILSDPIDVSGQPSGSSIVIRVTTANNKPIDIKDWAFLVP